MSAFKTSAISIASNYISGIATVHGDYGHLQVVYQGNELEVQAPLNFMFGGNWDVVAEQIHETPDDPTHYSTISIDILEEQSDSSVWELFRQIQVWFSGQDIDYNLFQNSNSYIRTMLWIAGINLDGYLPALTLPVMSDGLQGSGTNVLWNLQGSSTPLHLALDGTDGNDIIRSGIGNDTLSGANGNDTISTFAGNDILSGGTGNDLLDGGEGKDAIFGGAGDDVIFFDAQDLSFSGNTGFDVARYQQIGDQRALVIDMGAREIEVLISGNKADRIIADGEGPLLIAAGGGSDSIAVQNGRGSPTIVMGGSGRDTFNVQMDPNDNDPAGLLVIRVAGLTTENFGRLTLDMLGLPDDFDWSQIDLVVVNPEATDRITLNGGLVNARTVSNPLTYFWTDPDTGEQHSEDIGTLTETLFQQSVETEDWTMLWDRRVGSISSNFLNGDTFVYAPRIGVSFEQVVEYRDSEGRTFLPGSGQPDEMIYDYDLGSPDMSSGWFNFGYGARVHYYEDTFVDPDWLPESWFIYGGRVTSDGTLSTTLSTTLPPDF